ncbi:mRNA-decapping enzyme-like protein [Heracleum sosnowskyi]|uniref:mRNA-decapping enzyme-like protein n=1 Tax=Heracleum sosnowskyi TaxID=360622 RepID=A0AAD8IRM3_9APIA|nr:mRNA-decapping enzyme-like protein [Heracleum sosnowskyi]
MSNPAKLMPNLNQQSTKMLNLTVLQRMDPFIEEILMTAAHVTLYDFNIELNHWNRKDVEGSLFVVKRNTQPRFQFVVMNRRSTENLVENLLGDFEFELQVPYLLYRNESQEVNGIWFFNPKECEDVANLFTRILNAYAKVSPKPNVSSSKSEFGELEAAQTSAVIEESLEPPFSTASAYVPEDTAFMNFFSAAASIGHNPLNVGFTGQLGPIPASSRYPVVSAPTVAPVVPVPTLADHFPIYPLSVPSSSQIPLGVTTDSVNSNYQPTSLLTPSSFFTPSSLSGQSATLVSTSMPTAIHPHPSVQRSHGAPMLQPFPPPSPPVSLTPIPSPSPNHGSISRDQVRDALLVLVQENQFIEMFYQALLKVRQS